MTVRRSIQIHTDAAQLPGELIVPGDAGGVVVFAHGSVVALLLAIRFISGGVEGNESGPGGLGSGDSFYLRMQARDRLQLLVALRGVKRIV